MHEDVQIQNIGESEDDQETRTLNKTRPTADTEEFFQPVRRSDKPVKGDKKKRVKCIPCMYVLHSFFFKISSHVYLFCSPGLGGCPKKEHMLVGDVTTLRRHMAAVHKVRFHLLHMYTYISSNCIPGPLSQMGKTQ